MKNPKFIPEDFIESGFKSELIGRIDIIQEFKILDVDMLKNIIKKSKISALKYHINELKKFGVEIRMNEDEIIEEIAKRALKRGVGGRSIKHVVTEMFQDIYSRVTIFNSTEENLGLICKISKDTIYDNTKYEMCKLKLLESNKKETKKS